VAALQSLYNDVCDRFVAQCKELDDLRSGKEQEIEELQKTSNELREKLTTMEAQMTVLRNTISDVLKGVSIYFYLA